MMIELPNCDLILNDLIHHMLQPKCHLNMDIVRYIGSYLYIQDVWTESKSNDMKIWYEVIRYNEYSKDIITKFTFISYNEFISGMLYFISKTYDESCGDPSNNCIIPYLRDHIDYFHKFSHDTESQYLDQFIQNTHRFVYLQIIMRLMYHIKYDKISPKIKSIYYTVYYFNNEESLNHDLHRILRNKL